MGKRSRQRITGLTLEQRIKRSIKRKEQEEKRRAKEAAELAKALLGLPQLEEPPEIPMPPGPAISPLMRQLLQLEKEKQRGRKVG